MIEYDKFRLSLKRLEEQNENYRRENPALSDLDREGIAESVIQRFEICYDCLWKVLKRYLADGLGVADPPNSPKPVLRLAYENDLFAASLEQWLRYAAARTETSHDYDGEKAQASLALVPDFIDDAIGLYQTMTGTTWD
jgi:nucleotidyltransferase substrate binding protein (TIGR01987 family)